MVVEGLRTDGRIRLRTQFALVRQRVGRHPQRAVRQRLAAIRNRAGVQVKRARAGVLNRARVIMNRMRRNPQTVGIRCDRSRRTVVERPANRQVLIGRPVLTQHTTAIHEIAGGRNAQLIAVDQTAVILDRRGRYMGRGTGDFRLAVVQRLNDGRVELRPGQQRTGMVVQRTRLDGQISFGIELPLIRNRIGRDVGRAVRADHAARRALCGRACCIDQRTVDMHGQAVRAERGGAPG
ncbi:hypothetical protein FEP90_04899 [Burkholderia multivorans]|nr:hypothetical protein [Burkholderia multivorans]